MRYSLGSHLYLMKRYFKTIIAEILISPQMYDLTIELCSTEFPHTAITPLVPV